MLYNFVLNVVQINVAWSAYHAVSLCIFMIIIIYACVYIMTQSHTLYIYVINNICLYES